MPEDTTTETVPRIYVAALADYVAGSLHGTWIDATQKPEDITREIQDMLETSREKGEEWAIHDYEGFGSVRLSEYEDLDTVVSVARGIEGHGEAFSAWIVYIGNREFYDISDFEDAYRGKWNSVREYAEDLIRDTGMFDSVPTELQPYLDVDSFAADLALDLYVIKSAVGGVHIFWLC